MAEFFIDTAATATEIQKARLTVADGGSADIDGATDGACVLHMLVCLNNTDPRILTPSGAMCQSPDIDVFHLRAPKPDSSHAEDAANAQAILAAVKSLGANTVGGEHFNVVDYTAPVTTQNACATTYVRIPLRHGEATKKTFKTRIPRGDGTKDLDTLTITCTP
jgi:hypothetical protein